MRKEAVKGIGLIFLVVLSQHLQAQNFQKGDYHLELGLGYCTYFAKETGEMKVAMKGKGEPFYSSQEIDTSGWLSGFILPISFEYGVSDKIGVGLDLAASHFLLYQEDKIKYSRARILDLGIKVNYHLRTGRQNDFLIGLGLGVSSLSWKFNDLISTATGVASSDGLGAYFNLGVSNRYFFKKHVGVLLNVGYSGYVYPKVKAESASVPSSLKGKGVTEYKFNSELNWKLNGIQMGGGLAFKF